MLKLNRAHFAEPTVAHTVRWNEGEGAFTHSKNINREWVQVPLTEPFAIDVWLARHGYEVWIDKTRTDCLASVSDPMPAQPSTGKATAIYSVPVYSREIGNGGAELIVKGKVATECLADLFDAIADDFTDAHPQIPVVTVRVEDSDFGVKPIFELDDVVARPATWRKPIVSFDS